MWPLAARAQQTTKVVRIGVLASSPFPPLQRFSHSLREHGYIEAHPEGNITGFASQNVDLEGKRLELLKQLLPQLVRVGILGNTGNPFVRVALQNLHHTAEQLGLSLQLADAQNSDEIEGALLHLDQARPEAVLVTADTLLLTKRKEIVGALTGSKLPAVYPFREYAEVGGLIAQGANFGVLFERAAATSTASSRAPGRPICRSSWPPNSS